MNDLQANDAAEIARSISKDFAKYLAKYDEKKYPPEILLRLQEQFAYPKMVSGSDLRTALVWKYGHWGKPRIPAAHERLAKRIPELWISVPSEMMLTSAKTFSWWNERLGKTAFITTCFLLHLLYSRDIPILDQHNFRAVNFFLKNAMPGRRIKRLPAQFDDLLSLKIFMNLILQNWPQDVSTPKPLIRDLDRYLMMFGKSIKRDSKGL